MDIIERLAQQAAETLNGGEFNDGKWYTEGQRQAWRKAMTPVAQEIERLRQQNAELRELLQNWMGCCFVDEKNNNISFGMGVKKVWSETREAIAKATGGK